MCPEMAWSSSIEIREAQTRLRSPPRSLSPHQRMSPTRASSPTNLHPALQAVQAAIERWQQREQVGDHSLQGHQSHSSSARVTLWSFLLPALAVLVARSPGRYP